MAKINFKKITDSVIHKAPGLAVGALAANGMGKLLDKQFGKDVKDESGNIKKDDKGEVIKEMNPWLKAGITVVAGAMIPGIVGAGKKAEFLTALGDGVMAMGALQVAKAAKIPGIGGTDTSDSLSGVDSWISGGSSNWISGTDTSDSISGNND